MRQFSDAAYEWLSNYHGSIDATALLMAYDDGDTAGNSRGFKRGYEHGYVNA